MSIEAGEVHAQIELISLFSGALYYDGHISYENPEKTFYWCKKAAEEGYADSQHLLSD